MGALYSLGDVRVVAHATTSAGAKFEVNDEDPWTTMTINLPLIVEEQFYNDGYVDGYRLIKFNGKLMMFLEMIGVRTNFKEQYGGRTFEELDYLPQDMDHSPPKTVSEGDPGSIPFF